MKENAIIYTHIHKRSSILKQEFKHNKTRLAELRPINLIPQFCVWECYEQWFCRRGEHSILNAKVKGQLYGLA